MNDQDMQAQFIQWLAKKTGAKTEAELKQVIEKLQADEPTFKKVMAQFEAEMGNQTQTTMKNGGRLDYLNCLKQFKKGGTMKDCGCDGKKIVKGFAGLAAIGKAVTKAPGLAKGVTKLPTMGQKVAGAASNLKRNMQSVQGIANTITKVGDAASKVGGIVSSVGQTAQVFKNGPTAPINQVTGSTNTPSTYNVGTFGMYNNPSGPGGISTSDPNQARVIPKLAEKGAKLKKGKYLEGGILVAGRGDRLKERAARVEQRQENRAERKLARSDKRLVDEYNYHGVETSPGVYERPRSRFDEGAEALVRARQPLVNLPSPTQVMQVSNRRNMNILPNLNHLTDSRPGPTALVKEVPMETVSRTEVKAPLDKSGNPKMEVAPENIKSAPKKAPAQKPKAAAVATAVQSTSATPQINPANIARRADPAESAAIRAKYGIPDSKITGGRMDESSQT